LSTHQSAGQRPLRAQFAFLSGHRWLDVMLVMVPAALALELTHAPALWVFVAAGLAIVPLAGYLGDATEALATHTGPALGGIVSATMGNATELIIGFFALRAGHVEVVKASLSGSIIANLLLVLGAAVVLGGVKHGEQKFSKKLVGANSTMLFIAAVALIVPAVFNLSSLGAPQRPAGLEHLSVWTSAVLIVVYAVSFLFVFRARRGMFAATEEKEEPRGTMKAALVVLIVSTLLIAWLSEVLVGALGEATKSIGMTELFVGVIIVAIVGNAAEHATALRVARQNKMDLAMMISVGSSTQIALFVAPLLVFVSEIIGKPMSLLFSGLEITGIVLSVLIVEMISADGETNWFEGAELLAVYVILGLAFYFLPAQCLRALRATFVPFV